MAQEIRSAARLLLLDADRRLLLFRHADGRGWEYWAMPGGGLKPGETIEAAARREAAEELGATRVELVSLWTGQVRFSIGSRNIAQTETFFLVTQHSAILGSEVRATHDAEGVTAVRWWSLAEIERSTEPVFPFDLVSRLRQNVPL